MAKLESTHESIFTRKTNDPVPYDHSVCANNEYTRGKMRTTGYIHMAASIHFPNFNIRAYRRDMGELTAEVDLRPVNRRANEKPHPEISSAPKPGEKHVNLYLHKNEMLRLCQLRYDCWRDRVHGRYRQAEVKKMSASEGVAKVQANAEKEGEEEQGGEGKARRNRSSTTSSLYARPRSSTIQSPAFRHRTKYKSNNDMFSFVLTSLPRHRRECVFAYSDFETTCTEDLKTPASHRHLPIDP